MGFQIDIPAAGQNAKVRKTDLSKTVCAEGLASRPGGVFPGAIYGKVYTSDPGTVPTPAAGATQGTFVANDTWQFRGVQEIPGADCANGSPYPQNWLIVWAQYADLQNPYDYGKITFNGVCSTGTDCDP